MPAPEHKHRRPFTLLIDGRRSQFEWRDGLCGWLCRDFGVVVYPPTRRGGRFSSGHEDPHGCDGFFFASEGHKTRKGAALAAKLALEQMQDDVQ